MIRVPNISDLDLSEYSTNAQGFFFNLDLKNFEEELLKIKKLNMNNNLVSNGIIFVPVPKAYIAELIQIM